MTKNKQETDLDKLIREVEEEIVHLDEELAKMNETKITKNINDEKTQE